MIAPAAVPPASVPALSPRLAAMRARIRAGAHHHLRDDGLVDIRAVCDREGLGWIRRAARLTRRMCEAQAAIIAPDEHIVFTRTVRGAAPLYDEASFRVMTAGRTLHELGPISNICADWGMVIATGLTGRIAAARAARTGLADDAAALDFLDAAIETLEAVIDLARRHADEARRQDRHDLAGILDRVPAGPATTFHEALQSLRLCHAVLWLSGHYHCGLGRLDQYLWPLLDADLRAGRLDMTGAGELLAEFFLALNKDSDLYPGIQRGDNGQSLMLGGARRDGGCGVNPLTLLALRTAQAVGMIDPKINLRIDRDTSDEVLTAAVELTAMGLGFPQFANDEVVIPGLLAAGYAPEDARDYTVAACWEFIIPGRGMEVVNRGAVSLPAAVDRGIREGLAAGEAFAGILAGVRRDIDAQVDRIVAVDRTLLLPPAPYLSALMDGCLERGCDVSRGMAYTNSGIHGAASANAADALAAVETLVFTEARVTADRLLAALDTDFAQDAELLGLLRTGAPKVGNHDARADRLLALLFRQFADACAEAGGNGRGGRYRPGSGSAMYHVWLARRPAGTDIPVVGATADGRHAGASFSSSLAPAPGVPVRGPLSVLQSFGAIDYRRICNGGPLTMELADSLFAGPASIAKITLFLRQFVAAGCQQLQLNALNAATLAEAKAHPERHRDLVVRVWGWSGYFCDLEACYQDQIIARNLYGS